MATKFIAHTREDGQEQSVADHLRGTADRAETFADAFGAGPLGRLAGLLHDIGKYSDAFQVRIRNPAPTSKAVSYTHLDVYKRQVFVPTAMWPYLPRPLLFMISMDLLPAKMEELPAA